MQAHFATAFFTLDAKPSHMEHTERTTQTPLSLLRSMGTSLLLALFLLTGASLHAQTTRTSVATGNWSTAST